MFDNIITMLRNQGFTEIVEMDGVPIPESLSVTEMPRRDIKGMILSKPGQGESSGIMHTVNARGVRVQNELLILDVFVQERYTEARLKEVVDQYKYKEPGLKPKYVIVGYMSRSGM